MTHATFDTGISDGQNWEKNVGQNHKTLERA